MAEETGGERPERSIPAGEPAAPKPAPVTDPPGSPADPVALEPPRPTAPPDPSTAASSAPVAAAARIAAAPPSAASETHVSSAAPRPDRGRGARPELSEMREPLFHEAGGYRFRMDPPDLARLRELPGSKDRTERELGERFLDAQAGRLAESIAGDVATPAEVRVVVDPYTRQAFLAVGRTVRGIVSF